MSYQFIGALAVGFLLGITKLQAATLPVPQVEYSADRVIESDVGDFTGKVYAAKDKERTEISMRGMQSVTILRRDKQLSWMLMPSHRMYSQMDLHRAERQSGAASPDQVDIDAVGNETVEGVATTKYKLLMKDGTGGGFIWITDQGIAIKMDLLSKVDGKKSRMTVTLKNLVVAPQDAALFEVPSGYNAMPSIGNMGPGMGNMGGFSAR